MPLTAGLIVAGVSGLVKTGIGLYDKSKANADLKNAVRPNYVIPKEWYDDDNIAASQAQTGLTEPAKNYYSTMAGRGLQGGIDATLESGGNVNNIADLYDNYETGINRIAAEDSALKNKNIEGFIAAHSNLANEKDKQWTLNELQPYENRVKADNQKAAAGAQTAFNGISDVTNALTAYNTGQLYKTSPTPGTMGDSLGLSDIPTGSTPGVDPLPTAYTPPDSPFNRPGGVAAMNELARQNPGSPYVQALLKKLTQKQGAAAVL